MFSKNRDLWALLVLIFIMPFVLGGLTYAMACIVIFIFGGWGDVLRFINDWSWNPPYDNELIYKISSIISIGLAGLLALLLWKLIFRIKADDLKISKNDANLYRPHQHINAVGYFFIFLLAIYFSFDAWSRGETEWLIIFTGIAVFLLMKVLRKLK